MRAKIVVSLIPLLLSATNPGTDLLSGLDDCIQKRFLDTGSFGINRILPLHSVRQFRPANAHERATVEDLEQKGYDVALFLAGRQILQPSDGTTLGAFRFIDPRGGVQGPAYITRLPNTEALPKPEALLPDARAALASFEASDGYEFQKDGWDILMRPLRATRDSCVQCHTGGAGGANANLKVGDALGVVLYVFRPAQPSAPTYTGRTRN
jgi:hypothetical protein